MNENGNQHRRDLSKDLPENRFLGLLRLLDGYRIIYLIATLSLGVATLIRTGTLLFLGRYIDDILPTGPSAISLLLVAGLFILLALIQGFFTFTSGSYSARTAEGIAQELRNFLFDHIQRLSFSYHDQTQTGELIQRSTSDVEAIRRFYAEQLLGIGRILLLFITNFTAVALINLQLAFLSIIAIPFIVVLSLFFFRRISAAYESYQEQEAVLSTTLQENLSAVRVVKAFARQSFEIDKFEKENWEKFQRGRRLLTMHSLYWPSSDILASFQMLAGLTIGALMTINGTITIGQYVAYTGMLIWIIWPMRILGRLIVQTSMSMVSYSRIMEVLRQERESLTDGWSPEDYEIQGEFEFLQMGFSYGEDGKVLEDISFTTSPGESIGLLGTTGSGKTSLVNLLPRFYEYTTGSIKLDQTELSQYSRSYLRDNIGIVEQEPFLFSRSIKDNITLGVHRDVSQQEIESAARSAAIHDSILEFPDGYDTKVGERGVTLSGGQKQRIAIARTLLKDPKILILDDSTSSVDTLTEIEIREALENLMLGRTTFIIAHRIQSVMSANKILVLENGRIVQRGKHQDLIQQEGIYREVHEMQIQVEGALEKELEDV